MSWLPKEILEHLEHAGYVAVPKDRMATLYESVTVSVMEMHRAVRHDGLVEAIHNRIAVNMARRLLSDGFLAMHPTTLEGDEFTTYRAELSVLKPR